MFPYWLKVVLLSWCVSFLIFFISNEAFAADSYTYWMLNNKPASSPQEACTFKTANEYVYDSYVQKSDTYGTCTYKNPANGLTQEIDIRPTVVSCPDGQHVDKTLNPIQCNWGDPAPPENKCSALKGTELTGFRWESNTDDPPQSIAPDGCAATVSQARCSYVSTGHAVCTGRATYTGDSLAPNPAGSASPCEGDACTAGSPAPEVKNQDCVFTSNGSGSSSCVAFSSDSKPGTSSCGSVNGKYGCIENPKATLTTVTTNTTKTPTSNPNGTLTVVKDSTATTVTCSGRTCSSSSSHSSGTTTTDANGNVTGNTSTCTGPNCTPTGEATGGKGNTGAGTGETGDGEDEEGDSPSSGTLTDPTNGSFAGQGDDWDKKIEDAKKEFKDGIDKLKDGFKPMGDVSLNGGSKLYCPPPVSVLGHDFDLCLDKYASSLSWISSAILALCAMVALLIVFS